MFLFADQMIQLNPSDTHTITMTIASGICKR